MVPTTVRVKNADRMLTSVRALSRGIEVAFADGCKGLIPFTDIPEVGTLTNLSRIDLPNPYMLILHTDRGDTVELPWDVGRHYCEPTYRHRVERVAATGRQALGQRIRHFRERVGITQDTLATGAGIGRATLVRLETGTQSPRYTTLLALAEALGIPVSDLLMSDVIS